MDTLTWEATQPFSVLLPFLKGLVVLHMRISFPLRADQFLEGPRHPGK